MNIEIIAIMVNQSIFGLQRKLIYQFMSEIEYPLSGVERY